ncbi:hypothetical protein O6H91_13G095600 [Diphasiastrum complanatum]|uniref:Uncharacterized protein n=2 Tax=Diphasiastrum complanatum TaxID=34168 RepID=A0ACC2BXL0_DIPCM|nr:hypothetical protein O6H91_13G095600 [Diphasiastrum complanatum]KAJ7534456.1 hypothetical protein O6H91_13G095600 [Diphasiastrum complanatum]
MVSMAACISSFSCFSTLSSLRLPSRSSGRSSFPPPAAFPMSITCSSRPQKKATAHHVKTRPKKHNPYDKNRKGPTKYPRLPKPPPVWSLDTSDVDLITPPAASQEQQQTAAAQEQPLLGQTQEHSNV